MTENKHGEMDISTNNAILESEKEWQPAAFSATHSEWDGNVRIHFILTPKELCASFELQSPLLSATLSNEGNSYSIW